MVLLSCSSSLLYKQHTCFHLFDTVDNEEMKLLLLREGHKCDCAQAFLECFTEGKELAAVITDSNRFVSQQR